jgi:DNA-binding MarR family transcriptional regulator
MNVEAWRDLQLLEAVQEVSTVTQRTLAARLGIALGLTNLYLKRLIHRGYVKCVMMRSNRLTYSITPRGAARKARLTLDFMKYSLDVYRDARRHLRRGLDERLAQRQRVAIYGTGEAGELAFLLLREMGLDPVAAFDRAAGRFLGMPVHDISDHATVGYDVLIIASLEKTHSVVSRLLAAGVPAEKLLPLCGDLQQTNGGGTNGPKGRARKRAVGPPRSANWS